MKSAVIFLGQSLGLALIAIALSHLFHSVILPAFLRLGR